jgi:triosephosphate isomerase (TIM)
MRKQIAAANWKMNLTLLEAETLMSEITNANLDLPNHHTAIFAVPFPYLLHTQQQLTQQKNMFVAAQNCSNKKNGAFTGEVSASILASMDVQYAIVGHSERREYFNETPAMLAEKINICFENKVKPIFCCGEPLAIRELNTQNDYVAIQLQESLFHLTADQLTDFIIAYEPIWAIGTGKTASSDQAQDMHAHIRNVLQTKYGEVVAQSISILYGGSVKANNAVEIFGKPDVDGGLVGGASLVATEFISIVKSLKA